MLHASGLSPSLWVFAITINSEHLGMTSEGPFLVKGAKTLFIVAPRGSALSPADVCPLSDAMVSVSQTGIVCTLPSGFRRKATAISEHTSVGETDRVTRLL